MRDLTLRFAVAAGVAVAVLTELLSAVHLLRRVPLALAWAVVALAAAWWVRHRQPPLDVRRPCALEWVFLSVIALFAGIVGLAAMLSPPNSADAMAYHLPRVVYWAQQGSVAFFPTPYFNQITLQPLYEYTLLHTYLLTGGDLLVNLVAWAAFLGSVIGVSSVSAALGLERRGQLFAALFCVTLPNGILQASGAKNDWLLTLWLVYVVYFSLRRNAVFCGLALGLALATKATAYLFAPPLLAAAVAISFRRESPGRKPLLKLALSAVAAILLINGPQYARNLQLSGSPLGFDSAQGDGFFRWRNEHPGWQATASNALRHLSEQLGARSEAWNRSIFNAVIRAHSALGLDPQDQATTWRWSRYEPPRNANHEANANNRWHLLLLAAAGIFALATRRLRWIAYGGALGTAFLLFCFYLKWQPFLARLELPLFVLGSPLAALLLHRLKPACVPLAISLFLIAGARPALLMNWTRPLRGPQSLLATSREVSYFADMGQWANRASYERSVDLTARSGCGLVGLDISENQLEYPFQVLLRARHAAVRFVHTGVENASARYVPAHAPQPCAVLCPDCIGNGKKLALYGSVGEPLVIGRFLLFLGK